MFVRAVCRRPIVVGSVAGALVLAAAGDGTIAQGADDKTGAGKSAPKVSVAEVVEQSVPDDRVYTGTTAAVKAIELRAQVTGYLLERRFTEGSDVGKGDTLYVIDPRPFKAVLDQKQAELQEQEAIREYAKTSQKRYAAAARAGAAARESLDQAIELEAKTEAAIDVYKSGIQQAKINLDFAEIKAPFDGRVGRTLVNIGALVKANDTALASLVQLDPIYVYFSPPETELLLIEAQQAKAPLEVTMTLPHSTTDVFKGTLSFISNAADVGTATITMRATISNPGQRIRPGQFALVRLHIGEDPDALVVPAKAVSSIQGQRFVMVVGKDNKLERRKIGLGRQVGTGGYVVESGLSKGELVVVSDIRTLKTGETVSPQREPAS
jgi:membrane fusion protein, multidrug efflux system